MNRFRAILSQSLLGGRFQTSNFRNERQNIIRAAQEYKFVHSCHQCYADLFQFEDLKQSRDRYQILKNEQVHIFMYE